MGPSEAGGWARHPWRQRIAWVLIPVGLPVLLGLFVIALHSERTARPAGLDPITQARFEPVEPAASGSARLVALPHAWKLDHPDLLRGRYRIRFERRSAPGDDVALYFPGVNTRAEVRVNQHPIGSGADVPGLASQYWLVPLYRSIPSALLGPGSNQIDVELEVTDAGTGFVAPAYLGAESALRPAFELRRFLQVTGIQVLVIAMVSLGAFLALLSLLRRKDTTYFWFAVVLFVYAFGFWNLLAIETRIPKPPYRFVGAVTMAWLLAAIVVFVHRLLGERHRCAEGLLGLGVLMGSLYFWVTLGTPAFDAMIPFWGGIVMIVGLYPALRIGARFVSRPDRESALAVASGVIVMVAGFHDVGLVNGVLPAGHDFAIQHAAWSSMGIFAFLFVTRFIDALDTSEALSAELGERVEEKATEIEAGHARLRVLERQQAVAQERERILGEIHDGMGGQLVSALAMVRNGEGGPEETAEAIQAALDDMRLMIHSLDDVDTDLGMLLGSLRERIGRRLEHGGLTLDWRIVDTPQPAHFGPEAALQVMRIAQEAITNVIKHADASAISVRTAVEGEGDARVVVMEIADDGRGFDPEGGGTGRGLSHMRGRAERIGAVLHILSDCDGTRVRLVLPAPGR